MDNVTTQLTAAESLMPALQQALNALACAADDLARAAHVLRQESRPASQRFRSPDDLRRIAGQFADTARRCRTAQDAVFDAGSQFAASRAP